MVNVSALALAGIGVVNFIIVFYLSASCRRLTAFHYVGLALTGCLPVYLARNSLGSRSLDLFIALMCSAVLIAAARRIDRDQTDSNQGKDVSGD
jgi:hypothetical protein